MRRPAPRPCTGRRWAPRNVFHIDGRPISWVYFRREVWRPALQLAGLEYRRPYNLRQTYAYWSLKADDPIAPSPARWEPTLPRRATRGQKNDRMEP
jgi:hypothetical protein